MKTERERGFLKALRGYPRLASVVFGCVISLIAVITLEIGCRILESRSDRAEGEVAYSVPGFIQRDELLGCRLKPNTAVTATQLGSDGKAIYHVSITTDSNGRRSTPVEPPAGKKRYLLLFGGSFTFGEGLNDNETLPCFVGRLAPCYRPYNRGCIGYGPQQMLAELR